MPVYNGQRFLAEAIDSILNQTFTQLELIVVDDGSTDSTPEILKRYCAQDQRVVVIQSGHKPRATRT
jgi:glycosyltransferase involved in cell wall biosynthesis